MDRSFIYDGEIPREFDFLMQARDTLSAVCGLASDIIGVSSTAIISGLAATTTGSLVVSIGSGALYQNAAIDTLPWGPLSSEPTTIFQQGRTTGSSLVYSTASLSSGQSQWVLLEAQFAQADIIRPGDPHAGVLPFWNTNNPSIPLTGQNNNGVALPTMRQGTIAFGLKYGAAATTGSEAPPQPDAGWVPLYLVDLTFGQSVITQPQILVAGPSVGSNVPSNYPQATSLAGLLNQHHKGVLGQAPKIILTTGTEVRGQLPMANLIDSNSIGAVPSWRIGAGNPNTHIAGNAGVNGASDVFWAADAGIKWICTQTGTTTTAVWTAINFPAFPTVFLGGTTTGSANAQVVANTTPAAFSLTAGFIVNAFAGFTNTGSTTLNVDGTGVKTVQKLVTGNLVNLGAGDITTGNMYSFGWNGTVYVLLGTALGQLAFWNPGLYFVNDGFGNLTVNLTSTAVYPAQGALNPPLGNDGVNGLTILPVITPGNYGRVVVAGTGQVISGSAALKQPTRTVYLPQLGTAAWVTAVATYFASFVNGVSTIPFSFFTSGTYTTPPGCVRLEVQMVGAGGGGGAPLVGGGIDGSGGGPTIFAGITAAGGQGGTGGGNNQAGGGGGGGANGPGTIAGILRIPGESGKPAQWSYAVGVSAAGAGGASHYADGQANVYGAGGASGNVGIGSGGAGVPTGGQFGAGGGGAGEFVQFAVPTPAATYTYQVGTPGGARIIFAGTNGGTASTGGWGLIVIDEYYY